ncbi:MAG: hypothetical protein LRZ98_00880 [Candidatus Pacebacteria bacterium]|nr:hypothetical protein [Candidatus Paceibacterota bacterium]
MLPKDAPTDCNAKNIFKSRLEIIAILICKSANKRLEKVVPPEIKEPKAPIMGIIKGQKGPLKLIILFANKIGID